MDYGRSTRTRRNKRRWLESLLRFRRVALRSGRETDWTEELNGVISDLEEMNRSTEKDFLAVTDKLAGFSAVSQTISARARTLLESIAGGKADRARQTLVAVLENAREMEKTAKDASNLGALRDSVARIRRSLTGFERVGPSFHVMATLAQIETAHLGSAGVDLSSLACEFRSAGEDIRRHVDYILEGVASLEKRIESAMQRAAAFNGQSLKTLPPLIAMAERGVHEISETRKRGAASATRIASQCVSFENAIADIVTSIQVHDITRQQVEHVIGSLRHLVIEPSGYCSPSQPPAAAVIELQLAQLRNALEAFVDAIHHLDQRLTAITNQVNSMLAESRTMVGSADNSQEASFFSQMEGCFRVIAGAARGHKDIQERTARALAKLQPTLETLLQSVCEVHSVETQLRWLSLNTAISAAHVGTAGGPLQAVAAAMRELVDECENSSGETDKTARFMAEVVASAVENPAVLETADGVGLLHQLRIEIDELHSVNQHATEWMTEIAEIAAGLSADVARLRASISAERVFAPAVEHCCDVLRRLKARIIVEAGPVERSALLGFEQQYTMRAEREVHEAVLKSAEPARGTPSARAQTAAPVTTPDFGENVELF